LNLKFFIKTTVYYDIAVEKTAFVITKAVFTDDKALLNKPLF